MTQIITEIQCSDLCATHSGILMWVMFFHFSAFGIIQNRLLESTAGPHSWINATVQHAIRNQVLRSHSILRPIPINRIGVHSWKQVLFKEHSIVGSPFSFAVLPSCPVSPFLTSFANLVVPVGSYLSPPIMV